MKRPTELYIAVLLGVIAALGRVYFPTEPVGAWAIRVILGGYALVFLLRGLTAPPETPGPRWKRAAMVLGLLPLLLVLGILTAYGFTLAYIFFRVTLALLVIGALAAVAVTAWSVRRGRLQSEVLRVVVATVVFAGAVAFGPLCMWMWSKPDVEVCHRVAEHPAVHRLTPDAYIEERSFPYEMTYIASTKRLAGAFKMGGNLAIGPWDIPAGNRLAVVDVSDPRAPVLGELALEGDPLPQYMTTGPTDDDLLVNRLGYERHLLDYVDLRSFPKLRLSQRLETVAQPHGMQRLTDGRLLLATLRREIMLLDYATGEVQHSQPIHTWFATPGLTVTDMAVSPDGRTGYLSMFGTDIIAVEPTGEGLTVRSGPVGFGAGELTHDPELARLYQTDFFQNVLRVIDAKTLEVLRETPLGFTPRPVAVAPKRDLVAVGDWTEGVVHFQRRSTGEPVDVTIPVGSYLRELAVDDERGWLFAGTKCGLLFVELEAFGL